MNKDPVEKKLEDWACVELRKLNCVVLKGKQDNNNDWPDRLILCSSRQFFWIEFKRKGENPRPSQEVKFKQLREKGHNVYVCRNRYDVQECLTLEMQILIMI